MWVHSPVNETIPIGTFSTTLKINGLFPPTETETETDSQMDSKPNIYIVLCTTFSTGTEMEIEMETETETFPDGYCTHFRDGSPSQGQISIPIPYI